MLLSDLIADLRLDLSDPGASLFEDQTLERCVRKAVFRVGRDLAQSLTITAGEITPVYIFDEATSNIDVESENEIMAQIHACQVMRSATATAFSFSSGDKRVDKTGQPGHWAKLEADLLADYRQRLTELRPATQLDQEAYILTPSGLTPVIYEQGIDLDVVE